MKKLLLAIPAVMFAALCGASPLWMRYPAISPDGRQIAFTYKGDIYVVDAAGGTARRLTAESGYNYAPVWSPDSEHIAYAGDRYGNFDIFLIAAAGGQPVRLTTHSAAEKPYAFTPDGKQIYYGAHICDPAPSALFPTGSMTELYAVAVTGGTLSIDTVVLTADDIAALSGALLAFSGSGMADLANLVLTVSGEARSLTWQGEADGEGCDRLYHAQPSGSETRKVSNFSPRRCRYTLPLPSKVSTNTCRTLLMPRLRNMFSKKARSVFVRERFFWSNFPSSMINSGSAALPRLSLRG